MKILSLKPTVFKHEGWLKERFGDNFAQISVDLTLKLKSSIKDVARFTYGYVPPEVEELTKKMPIPPQGVSDSDFVFGHETPDGEEVPGVIDTDPHLQQYISKYPKDWEKVQKVLGLARSKGRHACAYVIANRPIQEFIPTTEISGIRVTQFDSKDVEAAGGVKMDFLVVTVLKTISDAINIIQTRKLGEALKPSHRETLNGKAVPGHRVIPTKLGNFDVWDLPEDQGVFKDICEGRVETVFQFDAGAARQGLREFDYHKEVGAGEEKRKALDSIETLAAFTALDRPGPLNAFVQDDSSGESHNMLVEFARRARGEAPIGTLPIFEQYLPETYGVMCFQEQLQKMYQVLTDCSGPEAEEFRGNVAKKKQDKVMKAYPFFVERASQKIGKEQAHDVFEFFKSWAEYGFNKSHAVCYVTISYACAYLKHHFPLEWWTAVLRNASKDKINEELWAYCGHLIDLPDLRLSKPNFEIVNERIRAPLSLLHGVGETAHKELTRIAGNVSTIHDFIRVVAEDQVARTAKSEKTGKMTKGRSALTRRIAYSLIVTGAMDSLFEGGCTVLEQLQQYEIAKANYESIGKKRVKKARPVDPRFLDMSAAVRFQMRKAILPAYSANLLQFMTNVPGFDPSGKNSTFSWMDPNQGERRILHVLGAKFINACEEREFWTDGYVATVAVPAYIVEDERRNYGPKKDKTMCKLTVDVNGTRYTWVKWPDKQGKLPANFSDNMKGALVLLVISKWDKSRPFAIEDVIIAHAPYSDKTEEESQGEEQ